MSLYNSLPIEQWREKTDELVEQYPLSLDEIRFAATRAWDLLWQTTIGKGEAAIRLTELDVPATIVGYFFEKLLAKELESQHSGEWRGSQSKNEMDLVYLPNDRHSTEIKSSGQPGTKVYGNRSYGKAPRSADLETKPEKSGYYITMNFYGMRLTLLRLGWIDFEDWSPQAAESGQAASLNENVYKYKLVEIPGDYRRQASIRSLSGVGEKREASFVQEGVETVEHLLNYSGENKTILNFKEKLKGEFA